MRTILSITLIGLCLSANAQIKVLSNGNTGIGTANPMAKLSVGADGGTYYEGYFYNPNATASLNIGLAGEAAPGVNSYGLSGFVTPNTSANVCKGVWGSSYNSTPLSNGRSYGVHGYAGNATNGYNYGVYGQLAGSNNGAAIYGVVPGYGDVNTAGQYAGYFLGNVNVAVGILYTPTGTVTRSDKRLKKNISAIDTSEKLFSLQPVKYNLKSLKEQKQVIALASGKNTVQDTSKNTDIPDPDYIKRMHYGFLAQDVQTVYPDLVYQSDDGTLGIDYQGMIPIIIDQLKKMKLSLNDKDAKINDLENKLKTLVTQISQCCDTSKLKSAPIDNSTIYNTNPTETATLNQNAPNPFNQNTTIGYYLPLKANKATICIYSMQGAQIKSILIPDRGKGIITIHGSELSPGMYIYNLIVDGKEIDTKRMILTN